MRSNNQMKRKRVKAKGAGKLVTLVVLVAVIIAAVIIGINLFGGTENYEDEKSFNSFAKDSFKEMQSEKDTKEDEVEISYNEPNSVAINKPITENKVINKKIDEFIDEAVEDFADNYGGKAGEAKNALLIGYESFKSDKNTTGIVLKQVVKSQNEKGDLEVKESTAKAFMMNSETHSEILPIMVYENGFKDKLAKAVIKELDDEYGKNLKADFKDYVSKEEDFANKSVVTKKGVNVYFDAGSVVDESIGQVTVSVSENDLEGVVRDKINPRNIDPNKPMVAITFDDGPKSGTSDDILDSLEKYGAVATYFELGQNVENVKDAEKIIKRKVELGCEIASHSYSHPNLFTLSDKEIKKQNDKTDAAIKKITGFAPSLYRPPYGNGNEKTSKIFNKSGILWSVDSLDWKSRNADAIFNVIKSQKTLDGRVILLHSIHQPTADSMKKILPYLEKKGYQTVTVSELLAYKYGQDPNEVKFYGYGYFYADEN